MTAATWEILIGTAAALALLQLTDRKDRDGKYFTFKGKDQRVITVLQKGNGNNVTVRKYFQFSEAHKGLASKNKFSKFQFTVKSKVLSFSHFLEISLLVCLREPELFERVIFFSMTKKKIPMVM